MDSTLQNVFVYGRTEALATIFTVATLVLINLLFFRYVFFYFRQLRILTLTVSRLLPSLIVTGCMVGAIFLCMAFLFFAMFATVESSYRSPIRALLGAVSFGLGSFQDHHLLMSMYYNTWLALVFVCF